MANCTVTWQIAHWQMSIWEPVILHGAIWLSMPTRVFLKDHVTGSSVEADLAVAGEAWETPWNVARERDGEYCAPRFVKADDCWKPGLKGKAQSYLMQPSGQRAFWQEEFIPEDPKELEPAQGSRG